MVARPRSILHHTIRELQRSVPVYIDGPANGLCEATFIFDNDSDAQSEAEVRYMQMVRTDSYRSLRVAVEGRASQLLRL